MESFRAGLSVNQVLAFAECYLHGLQRTGILGKGFPTMLSAAYGLKLRCWQPGWLQFLQLIQPRVIWSLQQGIFYRPERAC